MEIDKLKDPKEIEKLAQLLRAPHIGHEFVLSDNLSDRYANAADEPFWGPHPVKVVGATIMLCVEGEISYRINLAHHTVKAGEALVILPGSIMQIVGVDRHVRCATIAFASEYFEDIVNVDSRMRQNPVVYLPKDDMEECLDIYNRLSARIARSHNGASKSIAKGYMRVIGCIILEHWRENTGGTDSQSASRPRELYLRFLAEIQEGYRCHRTINHYASRLCVSPKYLSMVIKRESGRNASEYIDELVIFEAKALLIDGRYSVQQVAEMLQFPNPSFFSKYFRMHCGISPSAYRKR